MSLQVKKSVGQHRADLNRGSGGRDIYLVGIMSVGRFDLPYMCGVQAYRRAEDTKANHPPDRTVTGGVSSDDVESESGVLSPIVTAAPSDSDKLRPITAISVGLHMSHDVGVNVILCAVLS